MKKINVLVIDDSALVRQTLTEIINSDERLNVVATAADPYFAAQKIRELIPDVITLDIEMPRMDGLTFLKALMSQFPVPVVIISSLAQNGSQVAQRALELGALDIIAKSEIKNTRVHLEESKLRITDAIKAAYRVPVNRIIIKDNTYTNRPVVKHVIDDSPIYKTTDKIIAIGASTGGTEAIRYFLKNIPTNSPGIVITQHMPSGFTKSFADQVNTVCNITVKEATNGERVMRSHAYIAPGGRHMEVYRSGAKYYIRVRDGELVNRHKPSVDVLFNSVARHVGQNALGIIMTGMGNDGAQGLLTMKESGSKTLAQDEKSSVVFGMPKEAIKLGAADHIISLHDMPKRAITYFR